MASLLFRKILIKAKNTILFIISLLVQLISVPIILLYIFLSFLPLKLLYKIFYIGVTLIDKISGKYFSLRTSKRIERYLPNRNQNEIKQITSHHFQYSTRFVAEFIKSLSPFENVKNEDIIIQNSEIFETNYRDNNIIVCYSGHFYNFELMTHIMSSLSGYDFYLIYADMGSNALIEKLLKHKRSRFGAKLLSTKEIFKLYKITNRYQNSQGRKMIIGVLGDISPKYKGVLFDFLGSQRVFYTGMERLGTIMGAAFIYASISYCERGKASVSFLPVTIEKKEKNLNEEFPITKKYIHLLSNDIYKSPERWMLWNEE